MLLLVVAMAVAVVIGLVLAARGDGTTTTTVGGVPDAVTDRAFVDGLAAGLYESADGEISDEEAICIAEGLVDALGIDRLTELRRTGPGGDPIATLSDDEQRAAQSTRDRCTSTRSD